ncbi:MAG TPA: hypothetical protein ENJ56_01580, partial [Anaerolineae bacterium]|nr:hypothetical protein [Anaerolineae bacterium]
MRPPTQLTAYHKAAAVLVHYQSHKLQPVDSAEPDRRALMQVLADSTSIYNAEREMRWTLQAAVRQATLRQLGNRAAIQAALAANPDRPDTSLQRMFEAYVAGTAPALEQQSLAQLNSTLQTAIWLGDTVADIDVPAVEAVTQRIALQQLLRPFHHLVGDHFRGRQAALARLTQYVFTFEDNLSFELSINTNQRPPLLIYGPGGLGKSTLLAKFILDQLSAENIPTFPFAYIDFDRIGLSAEQPITLLLASLEQLASQFSAEHDACHALREAWLDDLSETRQAEPYPSYVQKSIDLTQQIRGDIFEQRTPFI